MTESDELKQKSDQARMKEKLDAVGAYLDLLTHRIDEYRARDRSSDLIYLLSWVTWMIGGWLMPEINNLLMYGWFLSLVYSWFWGVRKHGAMKEFIGAIEVLERLGMIPPISGNSRQSRKQHVWERGVELVKEWTAKKEKVQKEAFA